jgi:hypothetical protein
MNTARVSRIHGICAAICLGGTLVMTAPLAAAQSLTVDAAVSEAIAVHGMATASRLCGFMNEADLNRVRMRMDRVHTSQLAARDRDTYLIMRSSDNFRNYVYAKALTKVQAGCPEELRSAWGEVNASLVFADMTSQDLRADASSPTLQAR